MNAEAAFSLCNSAALLGWVALALLPRRREVAGLVTGALVPALLALAYLGLIAARMGHSEGGFSSLHGVAALFSDPWLLLAGWVHYLAFDLFIGSWETRDAARHGVSRWLLLPCQLLTFLFGPIGLLLYLVIRYVHLRTLLID